MANVKVNREDLVWKLIQLEDRRDVLNKAIDEIRDTLWEVMKPGQEVNVKNRTFECFEKRVFNKPTVSDVKKWLGKSYVKVLTVQLSKLKKLKGDSFMQRRCKYEDQRVVRWKPTKNEKK